MKILTPSARQLMTGQACLLQKWKRQTRLYVLTCVVDRSRQFVQLPAVSRTSLCNDKDYTRTFKYYLFMFQDSGLFQVTNKIPSSRAHNLRTYCIANKLTPRTTKYRPMPALVRLGSATRILCKYSVASAQKPLRLSYQPLATQPAPHIHHTLPACFQSDQ